MTLRPELRYRVPERAQIDRLAQLLAFVEEASETNVAFSALLEFNAASERPLTLSDVSSYYLSISREVFLARAAQPPPERNAGVTREELVDIVRLILAAKGEAEQMYYMELFDSQVTLPAASALVFNPPENSNIHPNQWSPSPEEVVALALGYRPNVL